MMVWGLMEEVLSFGEPEIIGQTIIDGVVVSTTYAEPPVSSGVDIAIILGSVILIAAMSAGGGVVAWDSLVRKELTWRARIAGLLFVSLTVPIGVLTIYASVGLILLVTAATMLFCVARREYQ